MGRGSVRFGGYRFNEVWVHGVFLEDVVAKGSRMSCIISVAYGL